LSEVLFPLWQPDRDEYAAVCRYLGLTANDALYERLSAHLVGLPFRAPAPAGFALHLAAPRLTRFRIARVDLATRLFYPEHPIRHLLNAVIALHECDGRGFRELAAAPTGAAVWPALLAAGVRFGAGAVLTSLWLAAQALAYAAGAPFRSRQAIHGRRVLITGAGRGLGRDLLLHCLERGAAVVGTVRSEQALRELAAVLPAEAPVRLVAADLAQPGALAAALHDAGIEANAIDIAIACAAVKHAGQPALSLADLRHTFEVNVFAAAELARWLCDGEAAQGRDRPVALVLVSSMGRWHGMHSSGGYNASKAALSIWGESLEMDLRRQQRSVSVTIVEPGLFPSAMTRQTALTRWLFDSRRRVAEAVVAAAVAGRRTIRPPLWFALLTWGVCLAGRAFRARLFSRVNPGTERK
jgi:short-subunit dehydrogenase